MRVSNKKIICFIVFVGICLVAFCVHFFLNSSQDITINDFKRIIENNESAIVYYGQDSCGACQVIYPEVKKVSNESKIKIKYLDADKIENNDILKKYNILYTPEIIVINAGNVIVYDDLSVANIKLIFDSINNDLVIERPQYMTEINYDELQAKVSSNTDFILYIGREDCRDCQKFYPIAKEYADSNGNNGIFYFSIKEIRDKTLTENALEEDIEFYENIKKKFEINWVPSVYYVHNGKIITHFEYLSPEYYKLEENERKNTEEQYYNDFLKWMNECNVSKIVNNY